MIGEIDPNKKPIKPQLFLSKPDGTIIAKLSEAFNIKHNVKLTSVNELSFDLPYEISVDHKNVWNKHIDVLRERYLIKVKLGNKEEWFIIDKLIDSMSDTGDIKSVEAFSLAYGLKDKTLRNLVLESKNAKEALNAVLTQTLWTIDVLDADYELTYRDFDFASNTVLDAVYQIAETFNAVVLWNTVNRTLSLIKPEFTGLNRGLKFSYGHYLKSLSREHNADEMVTQLDAYGKDGLSIEQVSSTGQSYIQDFSYFVYPFDRDAQKQVITSSYYMSDSLCHALLDYNELLESKQGLFNTYLTSKEALVSTKSTKDEEMLNLQNDLKEAIDIRTLQQFDNNMWFYKELYLGLSKSYVTALKSAALSYVVMCKVSSVDNITVKLDGVAKSVTADQWTVLGKIKGVASASVQVSGSALNTELFIQIANTTENEHTTVNNEDMLINKYSVDHKELQIAAKQDEINSVKSQISVVDANILELKTLLASTNNFTPMQLEELSDYIIRREFVDDKYIDPKDLYKAAQEKFDELRKPQTSIKIDIVNFLEIVEEQRNWSKLNLGDEVIIAYEKIGIKVTAKITEINFDYESSNISLTIASIKEINDADRKLEKFVQKGIHTAVTIDLNKNKWSKTIHSTGEISQILENFWNKTTNEINMANNEYVTLDREGITIIDPNDPSRLIRLTHGAMGLSRSSGLKYETAITADGIIAERLMGKILLTERVVIGDDDGIWTTTGASTEIVDRCGRLAMKLGLYDANPDKFGMIVNRYASTACNDTIVTNRVRIDSEEGYVIETKKGSEFEKVAWLDSNGLLNIKKLQIDHAVGKLNNDIQLDNEGLIFTRSDKGYRTIMDAIRGFVIQKNNGTSEVPYWMDKLFTNANGDLTLKGHFQAGEGERVFTIDDSGLALGSSVWGTAPLRADYLGKVWMNKLFAETAEIKNSWFRDGHIVGSDLTIGSGNNVLKMFPTIGLWLGHDQYELSPFHVNLQGEATMSKLTIKNGAGKPLLETTNSTLYLNNMNIEGVNKLTAEQIATHNITAEDGYIANLKVNSLVTLENDADKNQYVDYIKINGKTTQFITAKVVKKEQAKDSLNNLLWWTDSTRQLLTIANLGKSLIAYSYGFEGEGQDINIKRETSFSGNGQNSIIVDNFGAGDGQHKRADGYQSGKGHIEKRNGSMEFKYFTSNIADERSIKFVDDKISLYAEKSLIKAFAKDFNLHAEGGNLTIEHSSGSKLIFDSNGEVTIKSAADMNINSEANMKFNAVGNIQMTAARIDLN
ncbi:hypothetical protein BC351_10290 [Paenibacillus ferrarius]|uniref:Uncharacterized protein n=1 Tax=Paenibacillus ferrarius TaxID=1469647 RepID=A0A1V4H9C9_9BACL|nr:phage tail protein [Paenibacillus ferrarius]OPH47572.1 hypothetical protein BC351_10290 [Paenibacillus ferrarius]